MINLAVLSIGGHADLPLEEFRGKVKHFRDAFPVLHKEPIDVIATEDGREFIDYSVDGANRMREMI